MISMITFGVGILHFVVTDHTKLKPGYVLANSYEIVNLQWFLAGLQI